MNKYEVKVSDLGEETYVTTLKNGLQVYICKKHGFEKKIGMFGTKYGSIINEFVDITTGHRLKVPDGIAHFLEHKLFEQEGANALDLFSKIGVSSNAYTSFDQTVYFFETIEKFEESVKLLIQLIKTPYFTDENVLKEQGIIGQEISMYDDEPNYVPYFNALKGMYNTHPVRVDIAGTKESISHITKELLYTCYNTFYSPQNMFFLVVGDVDVENTVQLIEDTIKIYEKDYDTNKEIKKITTYIPNEDTKVNSHFQKRKMDIYMPIIALGYKLNVVKGQDILKRELLSLIISDLYFSKLSDFYMQEYNKGIINEPIEFEYEGTSEFSHLIISSSTQKPDELQEDLKEYIQKIKSQEIDLEKFDLIKRKIIGQEIFISDNLNASYRRIIDSIINDTILYSDISVLKSITDKDIKEFLNMLEEDNLVVSIIEPK